VTEARNDLPDQTPQVKPKTLPLGDLPGNAVVVRMKNGLSAVYAHLVPGSVKVLVGDRVTVGEELGKLGNSGGSLAPHLHFHVVKAGFPTAAQLHPINHSDELPLGFTIDQFGVD
jgi:murein DD-endopeptidase MepM/ murein hydrolase activator NlpD